MTRCPSSALRRIVARCRAAVQGGVLASLLVAAGPAPAQPEQSVKAAFVFNFMRFTEWPAARFAGRSTALSLCVWSGDARLAESMKALGGRSVDERKVRVFDVERPDELARCHALFIADGAPAGQVPGWLHKAESLDVLTMGDADGFAAAGGMIGLVSDGSRMRFEINDKAVKRSGVKLGAQLYQLGRGVTEGAAR